MESERSVVWLLAHNRLINRFRPYSLSLTKSRNMIIIGGLFWLVYLGYVHLFMRMLGVHHTIVEAVGIPVNFVLYYLVNAYLNFHQKPHVKQFMVYLVVTGFGWSIFLALSYISTDILGFLPIVGHLAGIAGNASVNLVLQQGITFGILGKS